MNDTLRVTAVNFGGFAILVLAAWMLGRVSTGAFDGLGLLVTVLTFAWVGFAVTKTVMLFSRSYDWTEPSPWGSGAALALPLLPLSLFWHSLSLLIRPGWTAAVEGLGFTIVWGIATYVLGTVARAVSAAREAPSWFLFAFWVFLCVLYGLESTLRIG